MTFQLYIPNIYTFLILPTIVLLRILSHRLTFKMLKKASNNGHRVNNFY